MLEITIHIQPAISGEETIMHRPVGALISCATGGQSGSDAGALVGTRIIFVEKPHLPRFDVARLNLRPGFLENFKTVPAGEVRILDQGDRRIRLPRIRLSTAGELAARPRQIVSTSSRKGAPNLIIQPVGASCGDTLRGEPFQ